MADKLIKSIVEHGNLTEFSKLFKEEVDNRIAVLKADLTTKIQAEFNLEEAADVVGKSKDGSDSKAQPKADDEDEKGPDDEPDADEDEDDRKEKDVKESIPGMEGPHKSPKGVTYYYDPKEGMYYDPSMDLYVTARSLGIK